MPRHAFTPAVTPFAILMRRHADAATLFCYAYAAVELMPRHAYADARYAMICHAMRDADDTCCLT